MDQVIETKKHYTAAVWQHRILECRNSGKSVTDWCNENNVGIKSYYYWLRKLRITELQKNGMMVPVAKTDPVAFKKLEVVTPPSTQAAVIIHLGQTTVEISNTADIKTVEAVLLALKSL